jgi:hypothetical protein
MAMTGLESDPYLSVVAASRNDDHGGNLLGRMQLFIDGLADQCHRHGLSVELVLVEWNPPPERPSLADALDWPPPSPHCRARIVRVPPALHARLRHSDHLPLFQMIAKNVGVRRARGRFVLATNIDVLFSEDLVGRLAARSLEPGRFYRVDRFDVPGDVPARASTPEQRVWCAQYAFRVARRDGLYVRTAVGPGAPFRRAVLRHPLMVWSRFLEAAAAETGSPVRRYARATATIARKAAEKLNLAPSSMALHTNACGDFTLMARDDWFALRGYPEFEMYSWHIDGVLLYQAQCRGLAEVAWAPPSCIYHVEHEKASGWTPEGHVILFDRLARLGVQRLTDADFDVILRRLRTAPADFTFNGPGWGLVDETLEDVAPG